MFQNSNIFNANTVKIQYRTGVTRLIFAYLQRKK